MKPINSRADLEALRGTPAFREALRDIAGACTIRVDVAEYPADYGDPGYTGPHIEAIWDEREDVSVLERLGLTRDEIVAELAAAGA